MRTDSGHGGQSPDASGKEKDGMDEVIFPVDYDDKQGDGPGDIIDDVCVISSEWVLLCSLTLMFSILVPLHVPFGYHVGVA
jgi:hypothetical protein